MTAHRELHWWKKAYAKDPLKTILLYDRYQIDGMYYDDYIEELIKIAKGKG